MISRNRLLIQVVPQLKPARCGVSDQAVLLAQELEAAFEIKSAFVILNSDERCDLQYPMIHCAPARLLEACNSLSDGQPAALLVHLSGYGYSADGAPALLAAALEEVREDGRFPVAVYFHELFASAMPWKSAFWHSNRQRKIVRRIAEGCDLLVTSSGHQANWLEQEPTKRSTMPVQVLPVFSAVGETRAPIAVAQREPTLIVFGLAGTRQRAYKQLSSMGMMVSELAVKEILDIGPEFDAPKELNGIPVRRKGQLNTSDLACALSHAPFGFVAHGPISLSKSSTCASYCAQGTIPVIADPFDGAIDGLTDGVQVISPRTVEAATLKGLQQCSTAAWVWHSEHNLHAHASRYRDWILASELGSAE